jgi:hypothetical protein
MDMDATIKGLPVNEQTIRKVFEEICKIQLDDDVIFGFRRITYAQRFISNVIYY